MTFVIAAPEMMTAAATDLSIIDADLSHAHSAATNATVGLLPAAADEVSAGVAHLFSRYAEDFRGLAGRASAFHELFAHNLKASAAIYTNVEKHAHASLLQRAIYHLQLLELFGEELADGTALGPPKENSLLFQLAILGIFIGFPVAAVLLAPIWIPLLAIIKLIQDAGFGWILP
jgi:hypothetical protein